MNPDVVAASGLTASAVARRHPSAEEDVTRKEWQEAVAQAALVVRRAEDLVAAPDA